MTLESSVCSYLLVRCSLGITHLRLPMSIGGFLAHIGGSLPIVCDGSCSCRGKVDFRGRSELDDPKMGTVSFSVVSLFSYLRI